MRDETDIEDLFKNLNMEEVELLINDFLLVGLEASTVEEVVKAIKGILLDSEIEEVISQLKPDIPKHEDQ